MILDCADRPSETPCAFVPTNFLLAGGISDFNFSIRKPTIGAFVVPKENVHNGFSSLQATPDFGEEAKRWSCGLPRCSGAGRHFQGIVFNTEQTAEF
jgi:hypothetical protein